MRLVNAQPKHSAIFWMTSRPRRDAWRATVIVKSGFRLVPDGRAVPDATKPPVASGDDPAEPGTAPRYPSDFVPFKPKGDFIVVGAVHAPGGKPVEACRASIAIGAHSKSIAAVGDRCWTGAVDLHAGDSKPFVTLPLDYGRAFGGAGHRHNPIGCGAEVRVGAPMPNFELPHQVARQTTTRCAEPAGFGAIDARWQPRIGKAGTYDAAWKETRWPWFPDDFDWSFFNAAPADQQFAHFRGDETLVFENLHPGHALYRSRLPGVRARVFVERADAGAAFEEVGVNLDSVWVDVPAERLVLVWRGVTRVASPRLRDIAAICAALEPLEESADAASHRAAFAALQASSGASAGADPPGAEIEARRKDAQARVAEAAQKAASVRQTADLLLAAVDFDVAQRRARLRAEDPLAALDKAIKTLKEHDPARGQQLQERFEAVDLKIGEVMGKTARQPPMTRERVIAALGEGEGLAGARLDKLDLSGLDFTNADLSQATLTGTRLSDTCLHGANLAGADLSDADLAVADFRRADLSGANLAGAAVRGANFAGARVGGAVFAGLDLAGADFTDVSGQDADFSEAKLNGVRFAGAHLPRARFSAVEAAGADFSEASLPSADFCAAKARGIVMEGADLTNLRASRGADFSEARCARARAPRSVWQQAVLEDVDFSRALLSQAQFDEASVRGGRFDRAQLQSASFADAVLADARLTNANLLRASFERADLRQACLDGSNLYGAGLLDATLDGATFRGSFTIQTMLAS